MMKPFTIATAAVALAISASALAAPAHADTLTANKSTIDTATFTTSAPGASAPAGVSPEVFYDEATKTYYLLTTSMPPTQYTSKDGVNWSATSVRLPNGLDWSIVQEGPSSYRLYFADFAGMTPGASPAPPCTPGSKVFRYATSTDLQSWTVQPGNLLDDVGCGVPHVMKTKAGKYFLYMNKKDPVHGVYRATSSDGLSWTQLPGIIADNSDLVDPAPLEMPDGTFVMVGSSTGAKSSTRQQELTLLSSTDAITWVQRPTPLYSAKGASALDPSVELVDGQLKVWYGYAPGMDHNNSKIAVGTIKLGDGSSASSSSTGSTGKAKAGAKCTKKGAKSGALVCKPVKGKLVWARR